MILLIYLTIFASSFLSLANCETCSNRFGSVNSGNCMSVDDCRGAALAGNCSTPTKTCCIADPNPQPTVAPSTSAKFGKTLFLKLVGNTPRNDYLYNYVASSMETASVLSGSNSDYKISTYLSQIVGESNYFRNLESNVWDDEDFDAILGNNQTGDGKKFLGRGGILVRGRENYVLANNSRFLNLGVDLLARPELAAFPSIAFRLAAWFWRENAYVIVTNQKAQKGDLSQLVDGTFINFTLITHALTNNLQSLKDRSNFNDLVLAELKATSMKRGRGVGCEIGNKEGYAVPICLLDFQKPYCGCEGEFDMRSCPYGFNLDDQCRSSNIIKCCVERCSSSLDLVIVMDSSGSIGNNNFKVQKTFVKNLLKGLNLGRNQTHVALINFNTKVHLLIDFLNFTDYETTAQIIDNIFYDGGFTYTADALRTANLQVLQEHRGMRSIESGTPKVVVVITDGMSENRTATLIEADRIKDRGFDIISVGIGNQVDMIELVGMASTPGDQYFIDQFDKLYIILEGLQKTACQKPAEIAQEMEIVSSVEKNSYKYYRLNLDERNFESSSNDNRIKFTIELSMIKGKSELFHSFTDETPKSKDDYINPTGYKPDREGNFVERTLAGSLRGMEKWLLNSESSSSNDEQQQNYEKKYYQIEKPEDEPSNILYFSVRGLEESNDFQVYIYNRTVFNSSTQVKISNGLLIYFVQFF